MSDLSAPSASSAACSDESLTTVLSAHWEKNLASQKPPSRFPLVRLMYGLEEIEAMVKVILSNQLTYGPEVIKAEELFAKAVGAPYAVMVNSGSSANLLAMAALTNPRRAVRLEKGDKVLVPSVCWSTSLYPIIQLGCQAVFVDTDPLTCNIDLKDMRAKASLPGVRGIVAVHVIGNSCDMCEFEDIVKEFNLMVMEDTCESMGTYAKGRTGDGESRCLGTFGDFGTFSMYFSHHITCGEGGMVTCKTFEDYELVKCLRAHGWTRHLSEKSIKTFEAEFPDVDSRFLFVNDGYNFRPLSIQAAMASVQIQRLHSFNEHRRNTYEGVKSRIEADKRFVKQFRMVESSKGVDPAWFGVAFVLSSEYYHQYKDFVKYLDSHGVENRPIISGNMVRQPVCKLYNIDLNPEAYVGAEVIHKGGIFIGVHNAAIPEADLDWVVDIILNFKYAPEEAATAGGENKASPAKKAAPSPAKNAAQSPAKKAKK